MRFSAPHRFSTDCTVALNLLIAMSWETVLTAIIQCRHSVVLELFAVHMNCECMSAKRLTIGMHLKAGRSAHWHAGQS